MTNTFGDYLNCILAGIVWGTFLALTWLGFTLWRDHEGWKKPDDNEHRFEKPVHRPKVDADGYDASWDHTEFDKMWSKNHHD